MYGLQIKSFGPIILIGSSRPMIKKVKVLGVDRVGKGSDLGTVELEIRPVIGDHINIDGDYLEIVDVYIDPKETPQVTIYVELL